MVLRFALVLLFFNCVRTAEDTCDYVSVKDDLADWPSTLNAVKVLAIRKRDTQGQSESGVVGSPQKADPPAPAASAAPASAPALPIKQATVETPTNQTVGKPDIPKKNSTEVSTTKDLVAAKPIVQTDDTKANLTTTATPNMLDLGTPGVVKRGLIVFGGFALLAVAYFIFKRKSKKNDTGNIHDDSNQFRYGVLRSDEQRDNMEFSRVPLTMDSEEEDDDLEIFDLEQKKKSLSYVNLQPDEEEFVIELPDETEGNRSQDNLLLDIEDRPNDTLINWSIK